MSRQISGVAASTFLAAAPVGAAYAHPFALPQPAGAAAGAFLAVIEIPAGGFTRYEVDEESGFVFSDRRQASPAVYPAGATAARRCALDALILTRAPITTGAPIRARAIGILHGVEGGEEGDKIIAVPASDIEPEWDSVATIDDLPEADRQRVEAFLRVYEDLPAGRKVVELSGFGGAFAASAAAN